MYALCVSGAVNMHGFAWKFFFYALYINFHSFRHLCRDEARCRMKSLGAVSFDTCVETKHRHLCKDEAQALV